MTVHELARCCLVTRSGEVDGHVVAFDSDVLELELVEALTDREVGDVATVTVLDPVRGQCRYKGLLGGLAGTLVQLVVLERGEAHQRRSAARAAYRIDCIGRMRGPGGDEPLPVTVVDVSASGIRFVSRRQLHPGDVVEFSMPAGPVSLDLVAEVLRIEEGQHEWRYGCELLGLDDRKREPLFRLVLSLQRAAAKERSLAVR